MPKQVVGSHKPTRDVEIPIYQPGGYALLAVLDTAHRCVGAAKLARKVDNRHAPEESPLLRIHGAYVTCDVTAPSSGVTYSVAYAFRSVLPSFCMNKLREIRERRGLSQPAVAKQLSSTVATVSRHESEKVDIPLRELRRYAKLYRCTFSEILDDAPPLDDGERKLIHDFRSLSQSSQAKLIDYLELLTTADGATPHVTNELSLQDVPQKKLHGT